MRAGATKALSSGGKRAPAARILSVLLLLFVASGCRTEHARTPDHPPESSELTAKRAREIVFDLAPDGKIESLHFVRKDGHLVWRLEMVRPAAHEIVKAWINPRTGEILAVTREKQK
jgi:hypothetical protein